VAIGTGTPISVEALQSAIEEVVESTGNSVAWLLITVPHQWTQMEIVIVTRLSGFTRLRNQHESQAETSYQQK
jgi:hypothetical protein